MCVSVCVCLRYLFKLVYAAACCLCQEASKVASQIINTKALSMKNEGGKDKDVKRNKQKKERAALVGQYGGWPTCWLAGREARLVWRPVVLVQM